jgi:phosphatidylglycerophosphate synthase
MGLLGGGVFNLPNLLSFLRLLLSPLLVPLFQREHYCGAFFLSLFAVVSDFLDGLLARRRASETALGTLLDPVADKVFIFSFLAGVYLSPAEHKPPLYLAAAVLIKELFVLVGALFFIRKGRLPKPTFLGKFAVATLLVYGAALSLYLCGILPKSSLPLLEFFELFGTLSVAVALLSYLLLFLKIRKEQWERE